jgi:hypothetical protein
MLGIVAKSGKQYSHSCQIVSLVTFGAAHLRISRADETSKRISRLRASFEVDYLRPAEPTEFRAYYSIEQQTN